MQFLSGCAFYHDRNVKSGVHWALRRRVAPKVPCAPASRLPVVHLYPLMKSRCKSRLLYKPYFHIPCTYRICTLFEPFSLSTSLAPLVHFFFFEITWKEYFAQNARAVGITFSSCINIALNGHAFAHLPQPMHASSSMYTMSSSRTMA